MNEKCYKLIITPETKLVTVKAEGFYNLKTIKALIHMVIKDPLYNSTYNSLIDIRDVTYTPVASEIFAISDFVISFKKTLWAMLPL
jgi:hypothetical protein